MQDNQEQIFDFETLDFNKDGCLFYPCAGDDLLVPLSLFKPHISVFWFADKNYFNNALSDPSKILPLSEKQAFSEFFTDLSKIQIKTCGKLNVFDGNDISPYTYSEIYKKEEYRFEVNRRRGYGVSALRSEVPLISVFFYRGDSEGEGGSGNPWLNSRLFVKVLARMKDKGLIVTDGSQTCGSKQYAPFARFHWKKIDQLEINRFLESKPSFTDDWGNRFDCVGYLGMRYGPTFVWQYHESDQFASVSESIVDSLRKEYRQEHHDRKSTVNTLAKRLKIRGQMIHKNNLAR